MPRWDGDDRGGTPTKDAGAAAANNELRAARREPRRRHCTLSRHVGPRTNTVSRFASAGFVSRFSFSVPGVFPTFSGHRHDAARVDGGQRIRIKTGNSFDGNNMDSGLARFAVLVVLFFLLTGDLASLVRHMYEDSGYGAEHARKTTAPPATRAAHGRSLAVDRGLEAENEAEDEADPDVEAFGKNDDGVQELVWARSRVSIKTNVGCFYTVFSEG